MYRGLMPRCIFFALFSKKPAKKFIFSAIFVVVYLSHLMHQISQGFIMSDSEYAPDSPGARGVTNPGAPILDRKDKFFATNTPPGVRTKCASFPMRPPACTEGTRRSGAGECASAARGGRVDCGNSDSRPDVRGALWEGTPRTWFMSGL